MKTTGKSALKKLLEEITPEEQKKTDIKMLLAAKIADGMQAISNDWKNIKIRFCELYETNFVAKNRNRISMIDKVLEE